MFIEREDREELKALSMAVFNRSGAWRKMLETGYSEELKDQDDKSIIPRILRMRQYSVQSLKTMLQTMKANKETAELARTVKPKAETKIATEAETT